MSKWTYLSLEILHTLNLRPLEIIQDSGAMQQEMTSLLEQPRRAITFRLLELDEPFTAVLLPIAADDFGVERHEFA